MWTVTKQAVWGLPVQKQEKIAPHNANLFYMDTVSHASPPPKDEHSLALKSPIALKILGVGVCVRILEAQPEVLFPAILRQEAYKTELLSFKETQYSFK